MEGEKQFIDDDTLLNFIYYNSSKLPKLPQSERKKKT